MKQSPLFYVRWVSRAARPSTAVGTFHAMLWDTAWDRMWHLSREGLTAWVEPALLP